ncbi:MAG: hypothetical protein ABIU86_14875 [Gemmatimonadaceae bacterium]
MRALLEHPEIWPVFGLAGRQRIEREFDLDQVNRQLFDLYAATSAVYRSGSKSMAAAAMQ